MGMGMGLGARLGAGCVDWLKQVCDQGRYVLLIQHTSVHVRAHSTRGCILILTSVLGGEKKKKSNNVSDRGGAEGGGWGWRGVGG